MDEEPSRALWLRHLQRVMELSEANEGKLSSADRRAIALELGIGEAALEAARRTAEDHFVRGQGYFERKLWPDAITELEEAMALDPERVEIVTLLARAHLQCALHEDDDHHAAPAERFARFALQHDPDNAEAFSVLEQLDAHRKALAHRRRNRVIVVAAGLGALAVVALLLAIERPSSSLPDDQVQEPASPVVAAGPTPSSPAARPGSTAPSVDSSCPRGTLHEEGKGCVDQAVVMVPGVGVAGLKVGESSPQDVLDTYGTDAKINRYEDGKGPIFEINYLYDGNGTYAPRRRPNRSRPTQFHFAHERLDEIVVGADSKAVRTPGGLDTVRSTLQDMLTEFGDRYELEHGKVLDIYRYETQGIEVWIHRESERVNSFRVIPTG